MHEQTTVINQILTSNGHRLTASRQAIVQALVTSQGHITADDLAQNVRQVAPQVGRMTVYRTLDLLCELGVIRPIYQGTGAAHYVIMADGSHHHLICTRCHAVIEFEECMADELAQQLAQRFNFTISSHLLELHGVCAGCNKERLVIGD